MMIDWNYPKIILLLLVVNLFSYPALSSSAFSFPSVSSCCNNHHLTSTDYHGPPHPRVPRLAITPYSAASLHFCQNSNPYKTALVTAHCKAGYGPFRRPLRFTQGLLFVEPQRLSISRTTATSADDEETNILLGDHTNDHDNDDARKESVRVQSNRQRIQPTRRKRQETNPTTPPQLQPNRQQSQSSHRTRTRAQIKKMKFLMMQDVETLIENQNVTAISTAKKNIHRLEQLYASAVQEKDAYSEHYKPKIIQYNQLIRAQGKLGTAQEAESILHDLERRYEQTGDEDIRPTVISYTEVIAAYAKNGRVANSAEKAEEILYQMMDMAEREDGTLDETLAPTSITCDAVLNAWAQRGTREAAQRAEGILGRMEYLRKKGNERMQPTLYSYATVASAWGRAGGKMGRGDGNDDKRENAERAQGILRRMEGFRKEMASSFSSKQSDSEYCRELEADTVIYNTVIDAWARSEDPMAGTRAEELLLEMEELSRAGGKAVPDTITYNSVIHCHANSGHVNAARAAERVLKKMEMVASSNVGMDGHFHDEQDGDGERVNKRVVPNTMTYNQVLKAYSKSFLPDAAKRADMILTYMLQQSRKVNASSIQPDVISFSTCLDVWAKSKEPGKAEKAYLILQKMLQYYKATGIETMKPNVVTYNTVLNACAFSAFTAQEERKKAMSIAIRLMNEVIQSDLVQPDAVTYGMLIKCIANLVPKGSVRNNMASKVFQQCRENGLVNGLVLDEIRRALPSSILASLLQQDGQKGKGSRTKLRKPLSQWELRDLPPSWRVNVVEAKPRRKRKKEAETKPDKELGVSSKQNDLVKPIMRSIVEQSWQSGRDV